ncbi:SDR family oxidoreductase [Bordetella sp. 15P40C-2]|uniref:SDR family oxidoreductase n=1 Tax=Bordetella sp. 15P40C-2 TaxID=2572246 RepID=UPI0013212C48|nr:SDR family oxidoreductase [Bordetella sp. 15P40C-2]MVW71875.1 NAD-dependent epimerase/dehydratase family protein [Bordetella sp. 15P40C-2]
MGERVLLAGCGDLGLRVAHRLLARGAEVWALRRHPPLASEDSLGIQWIQGDLTRPHTLDDALPQNITHVVYLPAPDSRQPDVYRAVFEEGLRGLTAALDTTSLTRVLFVSSSAVYGDHHGEWIDESTPPAPMGFNGRILLQAEQALFDLPCTTISLRLSGLYGPGRLQLIERLRAGTARAPRHPAHWANRIHIDDAAAAVDHLLTLPDPDPIYLGCDNTPLPLHTLYTHLARLIAAPEPADGPAPANIGSKRLSNARLRASGWTPRWPDAREGYAALLR